MNKKNMNSSKIDKNKRVVVTGLGVVSSLGIGWEEFWKNLMAGKSGISKITSFDTSQYDRHYGGEVRGFEAGKFMNRHKVKTMGRASQMAIAAAKLALGDGKLKLINAVRERMGVCIGTTLGESQVIEQIVKHATRNQKFNALTLRALVYPTDIISTNLANEFEICNSNLIFANACAAGNFAVGYAYDLIRTGKVDYMMAGGVEPLSRIGFTGFRRLYAMAPDKCQPFDRNRQGMMLGEGAGIIILENLDNALKRKADIYAEVLGYGLSCDACHMTEPSVDGIVSAMKKALDSAHINADQVDYINAHGTGTKENDKAECEAINRVFPKKYVPVSSIKSMLGHTMGAAAALETITCCLAIKKNKIPPTINVQEQDPECNIDCVVGKGRNCNVKIAFNNSQAFGGSNGCVVLKSIKK